MADIPIGKAAKAVRIHKVLSQNQLAARTGFPRSFICRLERDLHSPVMDTFQQIAIGLEIEPWKLLRYAEKLKAQMEAM